MRPTAFFVAALVGAGLTLPLDAQCELDALTSPTPTLQGAFGQAIAMRDDRAIVGSPQAGPNGEGTVYVYERIGDGWSLETELPSPDGLPGDRYGAAVDIAWHYGGGGHDDRVYRAAIAATDRSLGGMRRGLVYVFESDQSIDEGAWRHISTVEDPGSTTTVGGFGTAVAIQRDRLAVGSPLDDASGSLAGAVYSYEVSSWTGVATLQETLTSPGSYSYMRYGAALDIGSDILVVGAPDDHPFSNGTGSAQAYTFFGNSLYSAPKEILPYSTEPKLGFGSSVAAGYIGSGLAGALVGGPRTDGIGAGEVVLLPRGYGDFLQSWWYPSSYVWFGAGQVDGDRFGSAVTIGGQRMYVGSPGQGQVLEYRLSDSSIELSKTFTGEGVDGGPAFGSILAAGPDHLLVGQPLKSAGAFESGSIDVFATEASWCPELCDQPLLPTQLPAGSPSAIDLSWTYALVGAPDTPSGGTVAMLNDQEGCMTLEPLPIPETVDAGDRFGAAVDLDKDSRLAIVGAPGNDSFGLSGPTPGPGGAYIYRREVSGWELDQELLALAVPTHGEWGRAVAVRWENPNYGESEAWVSYIDWDGRGVVRRFREVVAGSWLQSDAMLSPNTAPGDDFGAALASTPGHLLVGAPGEKSVYMYKPSQSGWFLSSTFQAPNGEASFGSVVSIDGDRMIITAPEVDRAFAYYYSDNSNEWLLSAIIEAPPGSSSSFAQSAVRNQGTLWIGDPGAGVVYRYEWSSQQPELVETIRPIGNVAGFGNTLALNGDDILVGSLDSSSTYRIDEHSTQQSLYGDRHAISVADGGVQNLQLHGGPERAGELYWMLGSLGSTAETTPFLGVDLPFAWDAYTNMLFTAPSAAPLATGIGFLDIEGRAKDAVVLPPGLSPNLIGLWVHHAYFTMANGVAVYASEAESLKLTP